MRQCSPFDAPPSSQLYAYRMNTRFGLEISDPHPSLRFLITDGTPPGVVYRQPFPKPINTLSGLFQRA